MVQLKLIIFLIEGSLGLCVFSTCTTNDVVKTKFNSSIIGLETLSQKNLNDSIPYGMWKVTNYIKNNDNISSITYEEASKLIGTEIILSETRAVLFGDSCMNPKYEISKVGAKDWFYSQYLIKNTLNPNRDSFIVTTITCKGKVKYSSENSPNFFWNFITPNKNQAITNYKGIFLKLEKIAVPEMNLQNEGDTVKCFMDDKCPYSGYVIQGSRAKGHTVHVTPFNKNVPQEIVGDSIKIGR